MPNQTVIFPKMLKWLQVILLTSVILYFGKQLFIPLFFGLLIAIVMYPMCKWFEAHSFNKALAITACLIIITILFLALLAILIWQLKLFSDDAPAIYNKAGELVKQVQKWMVENIGLTTDMQNNWSEKIPATLGGLLKSTFDTTVSTLFILFITPVYTALFLYHRKVFVQYLKMVTPASFQNQLDRILKQTVNTYFNYIKGMVLVYIIVGILNSIGLFALGVKQPVLFGMLCAIMTIIPYLGLIISSLIPISVVWMQTGNIWYPIGVVAVFSFVQYLEANVIFPSVVGTQLHISTLAMLIAIISGGIIWGVAGMVLFIPFVAILKIISENIDDWKPMSLLLGRN